MSEVVMDSQDLRVAEPGPHCTGALCPACAAWVQRINEGANRAVLELVGGKVEGPQAGGRWSLPWVNPKDPSR